MTGHDENRRLHVLADAAEHELAKRTPPRAVTTVHLPADTDAATALTRHDQDHGHYEDGTP